jgi:hypothetical protein
VDLDGLFGHAVPERVLIRRRAEGFLEELAAMSLMRQADASDVWFELAPVEQRLLARIDALVACGDEAYAATLALLEDRPLPDPELVWAALFFFGSLRGSDAGHQVARLVRSTDLEDPALFEAVTDALTFAPNRGIEEYARGLATSREVRTRCAGIRVLGRRAACTTAELSPRIAAASDPSELRELAMALETAHGPLEAEASRRLLGERDSGVFAAAAQMAALRGQHAALSQARIHVDQGRADFGDAALICALVGDEADVQRVLDAAARDSAESLVEAVGWTGYVPAVPFLLGRQEAGSAAATLALQRITGATLLPDAPLPTYDEEARPFGVAHVPWDHEAILSEDPDLWRAWWEAYGPRADPARRYRFGHQWTALDNLFEMEVAAGTARTRRLAYIELVARTGVELPFDPRSFVVRQRRQLAEWREAIAVRRDRAPAGTWRHRLS